MRLLSATAPSPAARNAFYCVGRKHHLQERVYLNHAGNQNIPSRAEGANLDALGELFYQHTRPAATSSTVTMRFNISEAQTSAVLIPKGTRVSNGQNMFWATVEDRYIAAGQTHGDVTAECMTAGTAGNGYLAGQIATIVDVFDYYTSCTNLTESGGGSDAPPMTSSTSSCARARTTIPLPVRKVATLPRLKP